MIYYYNLFLSDKLKGMHIAVYHSNSISHCNDVCSSWLDFLVIIYHIRTWFLIVTMYHVVTARFSWMTSKNKPQKGGAFFANFVTKSSGRISYYDNISHLNFILFEFYPRSQWYILFGLYFWLLQYITSHHNNVSHCNDRRSQCDIPIRTLYLMEIMYLIRIM